MTLPYGIFQCSLHGQWSETEQRQMPKRLYSNFLRLSLSLPPRYKFRHNSLKEIINSLVFALFILITANLRRCNNFIFGAQYKTDR